jgi:phosphatidylglycerophosphatase A
MGLAVLLPVSFAACAAGVRMWGRDPSRVTIDEWVGCWIACMAAPPAIPWLAAAFLLFRLFDILKPWPVSFLDRMEGSAGVVLDDIAAGLMAAVVLLAGRLILGML